MNNLSELADYGMVIVQNDGSIKVKKYNNIIIKIIKNKIKKI